MSATRAILAILALGLVVFLGLGLLWLLLWGFPTLMAILAFIVVAAIVFAVLLGILVALSAIPFYFLKRDGKADNGSYSIEEVRSIKEDERK